MNKQYLNRSYRLQSLLNGRKSQGFTDQRGQISLCSCLEKISRWFHNISHKAYSVIAAKQILNIIRQIINSQIMTQCFCTWLSVCNYL